MILWDINGVYVCVCLLQDISYEKIAIAENGFPKMMYLIYLYFFNALSTAVAVANGRARIKKG